jgi:hypothetical protein
MESLKCDGVGRQIVDLQGGKGEEIKSQVQSKGTTRKKKGARKIGETISVLALPDRGSTATRVVGEREDRERSMEEMELEMKKRKNSCSCCAGVCCCCCVTREMAMGKP